ncbi:putative methyltransferase PMT13 [Cinnamomum micranthum f. kanehirae]|uniref:Methyltransferase n=1 Tax=Cinnamomum micranthum f. kanehirae TaxID=337451 RepID=A0A443PA24_9MAGN|nr:putative methyltransferase PMT13 [Cinnamomum micranthum f. kanehirae]
MGHLNLAGSKRHGRQWRLLDLVSAALFLIVFVFFLLVFTPLGDSLAASGSRSLALSNAADPRQRERLLAVVDSAGHPAAEVEACMADAADHMPCEDPRRKIRFSSDMNYDRERHCPAPGEEPLCLVPPADGYRIPVSWPESLRKIWHNNMPHDKIADGKGHQGWMNEKGPYFVFPGGGTMFPDGAVKYIERLGQYIPLSGGVLRTALDMGCGVASFGGYMLAEQILTVSFAPRDPHEAQVQFALERGIPAFVAMLGTHRLPFPAFAFDIVHCSQCLISFTAHNGTYFLEVDRLLRPGGYLVISGPPVQWPKQDKEWADLQAIARALCYELIVVDGSTVIWKKPSGDSCLPNQNEFGVDLCSEYDDPNDGWYYKLKNCVSKSVSLKGDIAIGSIPKWPDRVTKPPLRVTVMRNGIDVFEADTRRWARRVVYYKKSLNIKLGTSTIRNVMDMNALFGGFAASLLSDPVWVMNVVPARKASTLGVIYDRGLIGVYHDWCEAFSTYPRSYDFIHVTSIESLIRDSSSGKSRCHLMDLMVEMDRILRPEGTVVVRDSPQVIDKVGRIARAIRWTVTMHETEPESNGAERLLVATKKFWKLPSVAL